MRFNMNDMQNLNINKTMKYIRFLSFVIQWSFISMIINLFTLGIFRIPLFILMLIDAVTILFNENQNPKRPSFILSKMWDVIDYIRYRGNKPNNYTYSGNYNSYNEFTRAKDFFTNIKNKITNLFNNLNSEKLSRNKYKKERELNKFSSEIGNKITIEYTSEDYKLKKKSFEYKDRAITYLKILQSKGYKDYTKYNIDPNQSLTYVIFNKEKDIVDIENNKIHIRHDNPDYKFVIDGWPKKSIF